MSLLEAAAQLFGLVTTTSDHDTGSRELRADDEEGPRSLVDLGLHGFYSLARKGVGGLAVKMLRGGYLLRAWTAPPSDAQVGEVGINLNGALIRVRADGRVDISGANLADSVEIDTDTATNVINIGRTTTGTLKLVARHDDAVLPTPAMVIWLNAVSAFCGVASPVTFGTVQASTTKVNAG